MQCPRCQHENRPHAKFCLECGARFAVACAQCGTQLPVGARFCPECGSPIDSHGTEPARLASPQSYTPKHLAEKILASKAAVEGERKQVTVLFADLKGSMELLADEDPEEAQKLLDPVLERMMEAVHHYEGTVNQVMGDGIMALFGAPIGHEDHAVRASYAALRMQRRINLYADEIQRAGGTPVHIRVGLNSGDVVVRSIGSDLHMSYTAVGQTTHLAARIEQMAKPGAVLLTGDTLKLAEGYVQVTPLGAVPVKGLETPIQVYELTGIVPARSRLHASAARGLTRFVGRDSELQQLAQALERAAAGHGQIVAVVGEAGVGKSRLVWEFTRSHRTHGWLVLETGSASYGQAMPYLPVIELLKAYCWIQERDDPREVRERVAGKLLMLDRALEPLLTPLLALLDVSVDDAAWDALDPPQRRQRTLEAVKRLLLRESLVQPVLVIFEDLHWIDAETQALLDALIESLPTARVLLLVNYRPEYQHAWGGKSYYFQLRIDPLPPESAKVLLNALLGEDQTLEPLKRVLIERTAGNPFFLEESVQALAETTVLVGERGAYQITKAPELLQIPATAHAILAARIDRLPIEDKRLLQTASVIGKDVPFALLYAVADMPEENLRRGLTHLQAAEFLYETSLFPDLEYTFKHALTHEVSYGSVLQDRRRPLHARVVDAIEALYADRLVEHIERLAHHAVMSEMWDRAVDYLRRAGQRAIERSANVEAVEYLAKGLEAVKNLSDPAERIRRELDLQVSLGVSLIALKGYASAEVERTYTRARELCHQVGETPQLANVLWALWAFHLVRGDLKLSLEASEEYRALVEKAADRDLLLDAYQMIGLSLLHLGELVAARSYLDRGMGMYDPDRHHALIFRHGGVDTGVAIQTHQALDLWLLGYPAKARETMDGALALARRLSHPLSLGYAHAWLAWMLLLVGEARAARVQAATATAICAEKGFSSWGSFAAMVEGCALCEEGHPDDGLAALSRADAALQAIGGRPFRNLQPLVAGAYLKGGRLQAGLAEVTGALELVEQTGARVWEADLQRLRGELLLAAVPDNRLEAERCFTRALEVARRQEAKSLELRAAMSLTRLWRGVDRREDAHRLLAEIYGWFVEGLDTQDLRRARAMLEAAP
jgi:class 3 adenylate cyclase/predicted ATPase